MTEREKVIAHIKKQYENRFRVFDNLGIDKKVVAGQFPDIIFMQQEPPPNNNILFVMKIEEGTTDLVNSVPEWKAFGSIPSVFYVVVPKTRLDEAKKLASLAGIRAKFAWYEIKDDKVTQVIYE